MAYARRSLSWLVTLALVCAPLHGAIAQGCYFNPQQQRTVCPSQHNAPTGEDGLPIEALIGVGLGILATVAVIDALSGKDWATEAELDRDGPRLPVAEALGRYQAQGFARAGWPLVLDVETQSSSATWVEIWPRGTKRKDALKLRIPDGEGRRVVELLVPPEGPPSAQVVRMSVISVSQYGSRQQYVPLTVHGIGCGPGAVGSAAVRITSFAPGSVFRTRAPDRADFRFEVKRAFPSSQVEFLRREQTSKGIRYAKQLELPRAPIQPGQYEQAWPVPRERFAPGDYRAQVRVWREPTDRSWFGETGPLVSLRD